MARILLFAVLGILIIRALWRLLYGIVEGASRGGNRPDRLQRGERMERDPVCGTYVLPSRALTSASSGTINYFCSEDCRRRFAAR